MRSKRFLAVAAAAVAVALGMTACSSDSSETADGGNAGSGSSSFPVTIEHAFGTTTIDAKPERVATVAWANHEVPLALGVVPVGMAAATFGDDNGNGMLPWVEEKLDDLGAKPPVLFDETDGIDLRSRLRYEP